MYKRQIPDLASNGAGGEGEGEEEPVTASTTPNASVAVQDDLLAQLDASSSVASSTTKKSSPSILDFLARRSGTTGQYASAVDAVLADAP